MTTRFFEIAKFVIVEKSQSPLLCLPVRVIIVRRRSINYRNDFSPDAHKSQNSRRYLLRNVLFESRSHGVIFRVARNQICEFTKLLFFLRSTKRETKYSILPSPRRFIREMFRYGTIFPKNNRKIIFFFFFESRTYSRKTQNDLFSKRHFVFSRGITKTDFSETRYSGTRTIIFFRNREIRKNREIIFVDSAELIAKIENYFFERGIVSHYFANFVFHCIELSRMSNIRVKARVDNRRNFK